MAQPAQSQRNFKIIMSAVIFAVLVFFGRIGISLMDEQKAAGETYKGFGAATVFVLSLVVVAALVGISYLIVRNRRPVDMDDSEDELEAQRVARIEGEEVKSDEDDFDARMAVIEAALEE